MQTTTRKPARETHGTTRLIPTGNLSLTEALDAGEAMLLITPDRGFPTSYTVKRLADKGGRTIGFRLTKLTAYILDRKLYDIDITTSYGWLCDCPDAQFQNRECKHCRSLRASLKAAGIEVSAPKPVPAPAPSVCEFDNP
jgi:hypothetical protein